MSKPDCGNCGGRRWVQLFEKRNGTRRERRFRCMDCKKEGSIFDKNGPTVHTGVMRHQGVVV